MIYNISIRQLYGAIVFGLHGRRGIEINFSRSTDVSAREGKRPTDRPTDRLRCLAVYNNIRKFTGGDGCGGGDDREPTSDLKTRAVSVRPAVNYPAVRTITAVSFRC